jgi:hypothetical protein
MCFAEVVTGMDSVEVAAVGQVATLVVEQLGFGRSSLGLAPGVLEVKMSRSVVWTGLYLIFQGRYLTKRRSANLVQCPLR